MWLASFFNHIGPNRIRRRVAQRPVLEQLEVRLTPSAGALDPGFGTGGQVLTPIGGNASASALAVQPDGKTIVVGTTDAGGGGLNFALARYNADGTLDTSFSFDGIVATDFAGTNEIANAVALQPDGKIVVAGFTESASVVNDDVAVARYNPDGTLDNGFGTNGKVTTDFAGRNDEAFGVAVQADGKIVVVGGADLPAPGGTGAVDEDFAVARYNPDGTLDPGFGTGGKVTTDFGSPFDQAFGVAIQADGKIVAAGSDLGDFALARYNPDGSADGTFGTGGKVTTDFGGQVEQAFAVAIQADGKIVAAGTAAGGFALARYNPDGSLDSDFDADGKITTNLGGTGAAHSVAIQPNGKIIAGGSVGDDFALARYIPDGSLDPSFGTGGEVTTNLGNTDSIAGLAVQADGKIVAAGTDAIVSPGLGSSNPVFAVARYLPGLPPVANAGGPYSVAEGTATVSLSAAGTTDPDSPTSSLTYFWDLDGDGIFGETGAAAARGDEVGISPTYLLNGLDGPSTRTVALRVTDPDGLTSTATATITVTNVAPTVIAGGAATIAGGGTFSRTGSFTDPGPDTWTATVDYGDGSGSQPLALTAAKTFSLNHTYANAGNFTVTVTVNDDDGGTGTASVAVTVLAPPTVQSVLINDGSAQRSMVNSLTVTFGSTVTVDPGAFTLVMHGGGTVGLSVATSVVSGQTVAVLTFPGSGFIGGSLADGNYTLTVHGDKVHDSLGQALDGDGNGTAGGDRAADFFRLFGDTNGDRTVDNTDFAVFKSAAGTSKGQAGFLWFLDYNGDGAIDNIDKKAFDQRRGTVLNP
jgi:uncharacterized delta-60 repeat protein